tara:strand:- start:375 stop:578 length:204 start_codon:yes stop_codon:yes gene_type:complete
VTHVVVQLVAVVTGQHRDVHARYILNYGVLAEMDQVHVHVTGVITIKAQAAALTTKNQLLQHQGVHT